MIARREEVLTDADRVRIRRLIAASGGGLRHVGAGIGLVAVGGLLIALALWIGRQPGAGPWILLAALLVLVGAGCAAVGLLQGLAAAVFAGSPDVAAERSAGRRALRLGVVQVVEVDADAAWRLPGDEDDDPVLGPVLVRLGPDAFAVLPEPPGFDESSEPPRMAARASLRIIPMGGDRGDPDGALVIMTSPRADSDLIPIREGLSDPDGDERAGPMAACSPETFHELRLAELPAAWRPIVSG